MMNILIVEDEIKTLSTIKKGLEEIGFFVDSCSDGSTAVNMALQNRYDVIVSDIIIPEVNGFDFCKIIRQKDVDTPVIFLSALGQKEDKIKGFDIGADDYMVKPFEFEELVVRIKNANKKYRRNTEDFPVLTHRDLVLHIYTKSVTREGKRIDLTSKEFALLELLVRNKGQVVSRKQIVEKVWNLTFDTGTNLVEVYVNYLRKKIDKDFSVKLIHTKIGTGYYIS